MTHETLSALLDGECSDQELDALLDALDREPEMKLAWSRMQIARDVHGGVPVRHQVDICAAVMAGLGEAPDGTRPKVVELASRRRPLNWRTAVGLAAAASVAAIAITLGVNFGAVRGGNPALTAANDAGLAQPATEGIRDVAFGGSPATPAGESMDEDLRYYMIEHSNALAERGVGGVLSYAGFAANSGDDALVRQASLTSGGTP